MRDLASDHPSAGAYLRDAAGQLAGEHPGLASLIVFGSASRGGFHAEVSDVDLIVVLEDGATPADRMRVQARVAGLEAAHGFAAEAVATGALERFLGRAGGNSLSCFVCTRGDLLSGSVRRVLHLNAVEAALVDRIVFASIIGSAMTVAGEDLLPLVPVPPVRRVDVAKALFGFCSLVSLVTATYPLAAEPTRHTMGALKRSIHSCYYCYHGRTAPLDDEVAFLAPRAGDPPALRELLDLRSAYRESPGFVSRCIPTMLRLHRAAARDNRFPIHPAPRRSRCRVDPCRVPSANE